MLGSQLTHSLEVNLCACIGHIQQELLREGTILDIAQDLLHGLLGLCSDQLRAGDVIAVLSRVGDGVSHACETGLVDQINDQLHLVDALEVCISRIIASLNQSLETSLHQSAYAAAQNCLLTEQIGLGLGTEGGLQNTCASAADRQCVCQSDVQMPCR